MSTMTFFATRSPTPQGPRMVARRLAHDYLTQRGGAERVVLTLLKAFPEAPLHTMLYHPGLTYPEFRDANVITHPINRVAALPPRPPARPARAGPRPRRASASTPTSRSPPAAAGRTASRPPATRSSTATTRPAGSTRPTNTSAAPAWRHPLGPPLLAMRPRLRRWDARQAATVDVYLANSRVVQRADRRRPTAAPPSCCRRRTAWTPALPQEPIAELADFDPGYALVVSRLLPYKNVDAVIEAVATHEPTARRHRPRPRGGSAASERCPTTCACFGGSPTPSCAGPTPTPGCWSRPATRTSVSLPSRRRRSAYPPSPCAPAATSTPSSRARPGCSSTTRDPAEIAEALGDSGHTTPGTGPGLRARADDFGEAALHRPDPGHRRRRRTHGLMAEDDERVRRDAVGPSRPSRVSRQGLPWFIGAVDFVMILVATLLAIRFRVSLPIFSTASDVLENTARGRRLLRRRLAARAGVLRRLRPRPLRGRHRGVPARRQRVVRHRRPRRRTALPDEVPALARLLRAALPDRGAAARPRAAPVAAGRAAAARARPLNERVLLLGTPGYVSEIYAVLRTGAVARLPRDRLPGPARLRRPGRDLDRHPGARRHRRRARGRSTSTTPTSSSSPAGAVHSSTELRRLAWDLEDHSHVQIIVAPNVTDVSSERVRIRPVAGLPLMHLGRPRSQPATNSAKRALRPRRRVGGAVLPVGRCCSR